MFRFPSSCVSFSDWCLVGVSSASLHFQAVLIGCISQSSYNLSRDFVSVSCLLPRLVCLGCFFPDLLRVYLFRWLWRTSLETRVIACLFVFINFSIYLHRFPFPNVFCSFVYFLLDLAFDDFFKIASYILWRWFSCMTCNVFWQFRQVVFFLLYFYIVDISFLFLPFIFTLFRRKLIFRQLWKAWISLLLFLMLLDYEQII